MKNATNNNTITKLTRGESYCRFYTLNGKQVDHIFIYSNNEILFKTRSGWLETPYNEQHFDTTKDIFSLDINTPKRANKIDLTRKDNFYISQKNCFNDTVYVLYINANNFDILSQTEHSKSIVEGETRFYNVLTLKNKVGNFETYTYNQKTNGLDDWEQVKFITDTITVIAFDRIEKTLQREKEIEFIDTINRQYRTGFYSIDNLRACYNQLKDFFDKN